MALPATSAAALREFDELHRVRMSPAAWVQALSEGFVRFMSHSYSRGSSRVAFLTVLLLVWTASPASAQNYSFDARRIALGGVGGTPNLASKLVERQRRYKSILIPVGLVKVLSNVRVFFPNREDFDFSRAVEYSSSPFHFTFGRREDQTVRSFFRDIVLAQLEPDLNAYRGVEFDPSVTAEGLILENWGKTFMLRSDDRSFQGIYVGAGPYLAARAHAEAESELVNLLNSPVDRYFPDAGFGIGGGETDQLAAAITGGYRARFPYFSQKGAAAGRNGMYVAANFHYLQGLRLDAFDANLQFETDLAGLVLPNPASPPLSVDWHTSSHGRGMAVDAGVEFVVNRWDFGFGVGGIANRITWTDIERHHVSLPRFFGGIDFVHVRLPVTDEKRRLELPVTYTGDVAYHREKWSVLSEFSHGFMGNQFRAGLEYRLGAVELRGAGRHYDGSWYPSAGAGFNLTRNFGIDAALFGTKTFLERSPLVGLALSLRFDKR